MIPRRRTTFLSSTMSLLAVWFFFWSLGTENLTLAQGRKEERQHTFEKTIQPILREYCLTCHSTERSKGDLDLQRFTTIASIKQQAEIWEHVLDQLTSGEMPPKLARSMPAEQKQLLTKWIRATLHEVALANAGDPGPVVLRRLSNHEYTYTIRDLTGIPTLDPAQEFPLDGAAGEGFTNAGAALVMSPALLQKYLDAAKAVSRHAVLLPDGIRFSASQSAQDWTTEAIARIQTFYARHTSLGNGMTTVQQGIPLDVDNGSGRLPLSRYLRVLQGRGDSTGLSSKYLNTLRSTLTDKTPSVLLDPLRAKYAAKELTVADVEAWQKELWRFANIGQIGRVNGPQAWQEPVTPLASQQELRLKLEGDRDHTLFLVSGTAGDGDSGDSLLWENPRLVAKGRPDVAIDQLPQLVKHLDDERTKMLASTESCLAALAGEPSNADPMLVTRWRDYLGMGSTKLEPLLTNKLPRVGDYAFIQGWGSAGDLCVLANSSDAQVRVPGIMQPHSVATHPAADRDSVIAWKSPIVTEKLTIRALVTHAQPECGNGVAWALEVRRGNTTERLAAGATQGGQPIKLGPFENIGIHKDQVVALIIGPRNGDHSCDLTTINLSLSADQSTWDLAKDVSTNILKGNPQGPWHFLSQPATDHAGVEIPAPMARWRKNPSPESAAQVRAHLAKDFPLTHPLLVSSFLSFKSAGEKRPLRIQAPGVLELNIPADVARSADFVVTARLENPGQGSVQAQILTKKPATPVTTTLLGLPIIIGDQSPARRRFEKDFADFRQLFPIALCYARIIPVDEVITLTLLHREDDHLRRLILTDAESRELDRMWAELLFVHETPLKQVDAFEQLSQYASGNRTDLANEFTPLREPIKKAADTFKKQQKAAEVSQKQAVLEFASRAWRRPLTARETAELLQYPARLMLVRVLTSPVFLYRSEQQPAHTGPINDWELAVRLSYFLWSSLPDEELRRVAASGRLRNPDILAAQARRMLKDERIRRLATEFGCQWLQVRDLATLNEKSERHFPTFASVREDLQEEVTRFFMDLFQNDRPVLDLIRADHTFVNQRLAEHYGWKFSGTDWQRVEGTREKGRGGLLGFGATLAKQAGASRTSAILRGTWVSEVVLGEKLPKPPPDIPVLPEEPPAGLTERQLIERHSRDASCARCHQRFDPFGFALEGFDAIGKIRSADTKTKLADGTPLEGLDDLRTYLLNHRKQDFLRQFCRKLLGFSLGRSVLLPDQPLIDDMMASEGQRVGDLVELIVRSRQFREIRGNLPNKAGTDPEKANLEKGKP